MNDYDKAGRYLVKRDPAGFFRWLLGSGGLTFQGWIDARRTVLPNQTDLTNDLVAALQMGEGLEGVCLELEAEARADALTRLLMYVARLWTEAGGRASLPLSCVSGVILDLTGRSPAQGLTLRSAIVPGALLELRVLRRSLEEDNAAELVAGVAAGQFAPWLMGWVPLMHGGGQSGIISQWVGTAEHLLSDERDRADLGTLTLTLATLAGCRAAWDRGLRGWNMRTSPFLDEIRAEARGEGRAEGRAEGRTEGVRATILRLGRQKFRKGPTKKQQRTLDALTDVTRLEELAERLLHVDSWSELLGE